MNHSDYNNLLTFIFFIDIQKAELQIPAVLKSKGQLVKELQMIKFRSTFCAKYSI